jgi:hypothetical protein
VSLPIRHKTLARTQATKTVESVTILDIAGVIEKQCATRPLAKLGLILSRFLARAKKRTLVHSAASGKKGSNRTSEAAQHLVI